VLHSKRAIKVNIQIMRVFTRMREMLETHIEILRKLDLLQRKDVEHDDRFMQIFDYLNQLEADKQQVSEQKNRPRIGFKVTKSD